MKKSQSGVFFAAAYFSAESQLLLSPDARNLSLPREAAGGQSGELMCGQFTLWQISFSAEFNAYHRDHYNWPASFLLLMTIFVIMMIGCMLLIILAA